MKSKIEQSQHFPEFMRIYQEMRLKGDVNYNDLYKEIQHLQRDISYDSVYKFFRKYSERYALLKEVHRKELREKRKKIANDALDELSEDPAKLSLLERIRLGERATKEELEEASVILRARADQREEAYMEQLLNESRYGEKARELPTISKALPGE